MNRVRNFIKKSTGYKIVTRSIIILLYLSISFFSYTGSVFAIEDCNEAKLKNLQVSIINCEGNVNEDGCFFSTQSSIGELSDISDSEVLAVMHSPVSATWGISESVAEDYYLKAGDPIQQSIIGVTASNISDVSAAIKEEGVSPVFVYLYALNEGHNADGSNTGFINNTTRSGSAIDIGRADAKYIQTTSQTTSHNPSWYDAGNPVHFVPQDVQNAGNEDFKNMPLGTIGRVYIPATAAATWEVYYPDGLKKEFNQVQNYGSPIRDMIRNIKKLGGDPMEGGAVSTGCSSSSVTVAGCTPIGEQTSGEYSMEQLKEYFGDPGTSATNNGAMRENLTTVDFIGHSVQVNKVIEPCIKAVASKIQEMNVNYEIRSMGCYRFDSDNGSSNIGLRSYHTYGVACDINPDTNPFVPGGAETPHDMPEQYVKAFADYGFTWGGKWNSVKDYMHFEFNGIKKP